MKIVDGKSIIDYLKEQIDIYDGTNVKIEKNVIDNAMDIYDKACDRILDIVVLSSDNIDTLLKMQTLITRINTPLSDMYTGMYKTIVPTLPGYYERGYMQCDDLIQIALEVSAKAQGIRENRLNPDEHTIESIKYHAFEMVKGISDDIIKDLRGKMGMLLVSHNCTRENLMKEIEKTLHVNRSRAYMIAQTELSLAYNAGALARMREFNLLNDNTMKKYWYGFKYSEKTCSYCRPRIGNKYDIDDDSEHLPAHPRCRCVWLPFVEGWDTPISMDITRRADMLKRVYKPEEIYRKINNRLGIDYAQYMSEDIARKYINGYRSQDITSEILKARNHKIKDTMDDFDIAVASSNEVMRKEFVQQMNFWKRYVAENIVDNNTENLERAYEAIKGVMVLPWSGEQLSKWNKLLKYIKKNI